MFGISFSVGASPGACGLELASVACAADFTGCGTGSELAGLGSRLEGDTVEAELDVDLAAVPDVLAVDAPDAVAVDDLACAVAGASDWARAVTPGAIKRRPASKTRAARFLE
jgi:hypothetical protein